MALTLPNLQCQRPVVMCSDDVPMSTNLFSSPHVLARTPSERFCRKITAREQNASTGTRESTRSSRFQSLPPKLREWLRRRRRWERGGGGSGCGIPAHRCAPPCHRARRRGVSAVAGSIQKRTTARMMCPRAQLAHGPFRCKQGARQRSCRASTCAAWIAWSAPCVGL